MMIFNATICDAFYNNILSDLERTPMHSVNARRANHDGRFVNYFDFDDFDGMIRVSA